MTHWLIEENISGLPSREIAFDPEEGELNPKEIYGFVYEIENQLNGKKYIGKKFFWSMKTRQVNKKKKRYKAESDWKSYYGSNEELKKDVEEIGGVFFKRKILHLCKNKAECAYLELKEQIERNALLSDNYYNAWIQVKIRKAHLNHLRNKNLYE
jgi:hypothetical protein